MNDTFGFIKFFSSSGSYFFFVTTDALLIMMFSYSSSTDLDPICFFFFLIANAIKKKKTTFFHREAKKKKIFFNYLTFINIGRNHDYRYFFDIEFFHKTFKLEEKKFDLVETEKNLFQLNPTVIFFHKKKIWKEKCYHKEWLKKVNLFDSNLSMFDFIKQQLCKLALFYPSSSNDDQQSIT